MQQAGQELCRLLAGPSRRGVEKGVLGAGGQGHRNYNRSRECDGGVAGGRGAYLSAIRPAAREVGQ